MTTVSYGYNMDYGETQKSLFHNLQKSLPKCTRKTDEVIRK